MHIDGSPIPEGEIDEFEEAWEEIIEYGDMTSNYTNEKSYIMIEKRGTGSFLADMGVDGWYDFPRVIITPVDEDRWGVIINDEKGTEMNTDELKQVVKDFFEN